MPVRLFWAGSRHIDRLRADEELRLLDLHRIAAAANGMSDAKEMIEAYRSGLVAQMGKITYEPERVSTPDEIRRLALMGGA